MSRFSRTLPGRKHSASPPLSNTDVGKQEGFGEIQAAGVKALNADDRVKMHLVTNTGFTISSLNSRGVAPLNEWL